MSGVTGPHKDVDLLFPLEDLPAVTAWLTAHHLARPRGAAGGMVVTPLGYTDLLTVVLGPDGRWRPSWRTDGIPWPLGHPLDHVLAIGGYSLPILSAGDMWLRILADFGPGSQRARTEGRRLERLMSPEERAETLGFFTREQEARGRTPGSHPA